LLSIFSSNDLVVVHFYADWATQCGPMNDVLEELAKQAELKVSISAIFFKDSGLSLRLYRNCICTFGVHITPLDV